MAPPPAPSPPLPLDSGWIASSVVDSTTALVCVVDTGGRMMLTNAALLRLTGYQEHEVRGRFIWEVLVIPDDLVPVRAALAQAVSTGTTGPVEADWRDRHGGLHRINMHSSVLLDDDRRVRAVAYVGTDVTEQRRQQAELRQRAETDELTGLRNRAAMLTALRAALAPRAGLSGDAVGILFCDLDGFKQVNDEHGHLVGDALLIEVGQRLLSVTHAGQIVSRLGGDEFLILIPEATPVALTQLSAKIQAAIERPYVTVHGQASVGVSIGTALGRAGDDPTLLIEQADRHMYGIKTTSR